MESPTKERLTGALILVSALIILIPEILSGPDDDRAAETSREVVAEAGPPLSTYEVVLDPAATDRTARPDTRPDSDGAPAPVAEPVAVPPPVTEQVVPPASVTQPAAASAPQPVVTAPPARPATPAPAPPRPAAAAAGGWWVQIGSYSSRDNADRVARQLRDAGFSIDVSQIRSAGKEMHRVRAGPARDREAAVALRARISAAGHRDASLVAP